MFFLQKETTIVGILGRIAARQLQRSKYVKEQQLTEQATRIGPPNRIGSGGAPWTPAARSTADNTNWAAMMMKHKRNKRRPSSRWGGTGDGPPGGA
mgnify:CR=1 FL=1